MNLFFKIESILESVKNTRKMSYQVYSAKKKIIKINYMEGWLEGKKIIKECGGTKYHFLQDNNKMKYCSYISVRISFIFHLLVLTGRYCWTGVSATVTIITGSTGAVLSAISRGRVVANPGPWPLASTARDTAGSPLTPGAPRTVNFRIEVNL